LVFETMTPSGVEQSTTAPRPIRGHAVFETMTPSGVERVVKMGRPRKPTKWTRR